MIWFSTKIFLNNCSFLLYAFSLSRYSTIKDADIDEKRLTLKFSSINIYILCTYTGMCRYVQFYLLLQEWTNSAYRSAVGRCSQQSWLPRSLAGRSVEPSTWHQEHHYKEETRRWFLGLAQPLRWSMYLYSFMYEYLVICKYVYFYFLQNSRLYYLTLFGYLSFRIVAWRFAK